MGSVSIFNNTKEPEFCDIVSIFSNSPLVEGKGRGNELYDLTGIYGQKFTNNKQSDQTLDPTFIIPFTNIKLGSAREV